MTSVVALLYVSTICFAGAFLFTAIDNLEPDRRVALVLTSAQSLQQAERPLQINCCPDVDGDDRTIADFFARLSSARSGALGVDTGSAGVAGALAISLKLA
jgi:hypothetical protein